MEAVGEEGWEIYGNICWSRTTDCEMKFWSGDFENGGTLFAFY